MIEIFNIVSEHKDDIAAIGGAVVVIASALANIFPKASFLGKIVHFLAINFKVDK